jgi:hypothetical protein
VDEPETSLLEAKDESQENDDHGAVREDEAKKGTEKAEKKEERRSASSAVDVSRNHSIPWRTPPSTPSFHPPLIRPTVYYVVAKGGEKGGKKRTYTPNSPIKNHNCGLKPPTTEG